MWLGVYTLLLVILTGEDYPLYLGYKLPIKDPNIEDVNFELKLLEKLREILEIEHMIK